MYSSPKPFPFLPEGGRIEYAPIGHPWIRAAQQVSETVARGCNWCVGAVIVRNDEVLEAAGNNEATEDRPLFCVRRAFGCKTGERYDLCGLCRGAHAEATAVQRAQAKGIDVRGADVYLYGHWWCCAACWTAMIDAGITRVFLPEGATELFEVLPQRRPDWLEEPRVHILGDHPEIVPVLRRGLELAGVVEHPEGVVVHVTPHEIRVDLRSCEVTDTFETVKQLSAMLHDALVARYAS